MAGTTKNVLKLVATTSSKIRNLTISDGQLVFLQDIGRIAFDFKGKRVFYNQIVELETEAERLALENPLDGYYFVIGSGVLWSYKGGWIQITNQPSNIEFIDVALPQLGQENKLYINKTERDISVWDDEIGDYIKVANYTDSISAEDIKKLFS
jgi:hypothetical protein